MRFEQPKHLADAYREQQYRAIRPALCFLSVCLSLIALLKVWMRHRAEHSVSIWNWFLAGSIGGFAFFLYRWGICFGLSRPRYVDLQGDKLFLAERGKIGVNRITEWSLKPDAAMPHCLRLLIVYRFGFGKKRWWMLLDDHDQALLLKRALETHFPESARSY
jgi:hypothetical protein